MSGFAISYMTCNSLPARSRLLSPGHIHLAQFSSLSCCNSPFLESKLLHIHRHHFRDSSASYSITFNHTTRSKSFTEIKTASQIQKVGIAWLFRVISSSL